MGIQLNHRTLTMNLAHGRTPAAMPDPTPARRALFVGGPWHGTIRDLPTATHTILVPVADPIPRAAYDDPNLLSFLQWRDRRYDWQQYATVETDGYAVAEVWAFDDVPQPLDSADAYRMTTDAALRCLIRSGDLPHKFTDMHDRLDGHTIGDEDPRLAQRERCTPTAAERDAAAAVIDRARRAREDTERQVQRMRDAGIPPELIGTREADGASG